MSKFIYHGAFHGHTGSVTSLAASSSDSTDTLVSVSHDKTLTKWKVTYDEANFLIPERTVSAHTKKIEDVALAIDGHCAVTASWDRALRLWDLKTGRMVSEFVGHQSDVLSVCTSPDGSQIVSASRDGRIKVWNARGEYQHDLTENRQTDAVYAICFLPSTRLPMVVSAGWDKTVKVWDFDRMKLFCKLGGHRDHIHTVAVSTDGSVCASGGREGKVMLWNLTSYQHLHSFNTGDSIHSLAFSPSQSWLAAATTSHIHIWDIATRLTICKLYTKSIGDSPSAAEPKCLSLAWSADGSVLFGGYSDSTIRVWEVESG